MWGISSRTGESTRMSRCGGDIASHVCHSCHLVVLQVVGSFTNLGESRLVSHKI